MQLGTRQSDEARARMSATVKQLWAKRKETGWKRSRNSTESTGAEIKRAERALVLRMLKEIETMPQQESSESEQC